MSSRSGLTLVEMLAVLFILALVAGVAVTATEGLIDQSRLDATQRGLDALEEAILGEADARQPDGTPICSGFLQDIGRLPRAQDDTHPDADTARSRRLKELWEKPDDVPAFGMGALPKDPGDTTPILPAGWRGPYLKLGAGAVGVRDGWGHPVIPFPEDASDFSAFPPVSTPPEEVSIFLSFGPNRAFDNSDLFEGRTIWKTTSIVTPTVEARQTGEAQVTVESAGALPTAARAIVRVFGPVNGLPSVIAHADFSTAELPKTLSFSSIPAGLRYARVYLHDGAAAAITDDVPSPVYRSVVKPLVVGSGTSAVVIHLP